MRKVSLGGKVGGKRRVAERCSGYHGYFLSQNLGKDWGLSDAQTQKEKYRLFPWVGKRTWRKQSTWIAKLFPKKLPAHVFGLRFGTNEEELWKPPFKGPCSKGGANKAPIVKIHVGGPFEVTGHVGPKKTGTGHSKKESQGLAVFVWP